MEDLIRAMKNKSTEVCRIAICGQGGSGKTTLAKAIYHQIHGRFTEKIFIEDIRKVSGIRGDRGLLEQLLSDVLKTMVETGTFEMGRRMIRERLYGKRVLIVLDDAPPLYVSLLWECRHWYGGGSVIIITKTHDLQMISQADSIFQVELMNTDESLELLSWHAFREAKPKEDYLFLAERVVSYCGGLPLALEVIGSYLYERTKREWNRVLLKLKKIPEHIKFDQILKISFDGLCNQMEKDLFLDLCCSFVGKGRAYVTKILNGCGIDADSGIRVLIQRSLIRVNNNKKLGMHPLLRQMGRKIIGEIIDEDMKLAIVRTFLIYGFETSFGSGCFLM